MKVFMINSAILLSFLVIYKLPNWQNTKDIRVILDNENVCVQTYI